MGIINFTAPSTGGNIFVEIILWLVNLTGVVGGVVLFTLMLKLITFPFDYASRASMRKNSLKMEEMRPELEKLQRQYADNKDLYNQKMMNLYKKNGYSMFGACLPTILTLVIFIVALNGFSAYSQYQNRQYFYNMSLSYNNVVYSGFEVDDSYIIADEQGKVIINQEKLLSENAFNIGEEKQVGKINFLVESLANEEYKLTLSTDNGYIEYSCKYKINNGQREWFNVPTYKVISSKLDNNEVLASEKNNYLKVKDGQIEYSFSQWKEIAFEKEIRKEYDYKVNKAYEDYVNSKPENAKEEKDFKDEYKKNNTFEDFKANFLLTNSVDSYSEKLANNFILDIQQEKSAQTFRKENASFLWVKNVWATDSPMAHPIESNWSTFKQTHAYNDNDIGESSYASLIEKLEEERNAPNGFFILVLLTAGSSFVMQVVMGKAQKAQMELQTVDGQGAQTQKIMKWMMPIMMAFFAFMYTAAFSIYIILSSLISMGTTFLINFIVDIQMKKQKPKKDEQTIRGRIYTPKQEEKQQPKKNDKPKKDDKFAHEKGEDFLTGKADKKHPRGRLK